MLLFRLFRSYPVHSLDTCIGKETREGSLLENYVGRDGHQSKFSLQWVADNFYTAGPRVERFLWDGPRINKEHLPVTTFDHRMKKDDGLKHTLNNVIKYGFCIVDGAPATTEGTELVTKRISFTLETFYGRVCSIAPENTERCNTAYTSASLGAHTETTYLTTPAG